jgi:hypothetical protein
LPSKQPKGDSHGQNILHAAQSFRHDTHVRWVYALSPSLSLPLSLSPSLSFSLSLSLSLSLSASSLIFPPSFLLETGRLSSFVYDLSPFLLYAENPFPYLSRRDVMKVHISLLLPFLLTLLTLFAILVRFCNCISGGNPINKL